MVGNMLKVLVASVGASVLAFGAYLWISASRIIGGRPGVAVDIGDLMRVTLRSPSFWVLMVLVFSCVFLLYRSAGSF
jgi:hypothetical protein